MVAPVLTVLTQAFLYALSRPVPAAPALQSPPQVASAVLLVSLSPHSPGPGWLLAAGAAEPDTHPAHHMTAAAAPGVSQQTATPAPRWLSGGTADTTEG